MMDDIARRIEKAGVTWKVRKDKEGRHIGPDVMPVGSLRNPQPTEEITLKTQEGKLTINIVDKLDTLGTRISNKGGDVESIDYRIAKADRAFWNKKTRTFRGKGSVPTTYQLSPTRPGRWPCTEPGLGI